MAKSWQCRVTIKSFWILLPFLCSGLTHQCRTAGVCMRVPLCCLPPAQRSLPRTRATGCLSMLLILVVAAGLHVPAAHMTTFRPCSRGVAGKHLQKVRGFGEAEEAGHLPAPLHPLQHVGARTLRVTRAPSSEEEGGMWPQTQRPAASPPLVQKSPDSTVDAPHPSLQATPKLWSVRVATWTWFKRESSPKNDNSVDIYYLPSCCSKALCSYFNTTQKWEASHSFFSPFSNHY